MAVRAESKKRAKGVKAADRLQKPTVPEGKTVLRGGKTYPLGVGKGKVEQAENGGRCPLRREGRGTAEGKDTPITERKQESW